jgi:HAD superfamily hydrolase (TIGR01662 family)
MLRQLSQVGVSITRIYYCSHSLADQCECRKPGTKLLTDALAYFHARTESCFLIGDSFSDIEAATNAGCQGLRVHSQPNGSLDADSAMSFPEAVNVILAKSGFPLMN